MIHFLLLLLLFVGIIIPIVCGESAFGPCFVMQYCVPFLVLRSSGWGEGAGCFSIIVFLVSFDCSSFSQYHGLVCTVSL